MFFLVIHPELFSHFYDLPIHPFRITFLRINPLTFRIWY